MQLLPVPNACSVATEAGQVLRCRLGLLASDCAASIPNNGFSPNPLCIDCDQPPVVKILKLYGELHSTLQTGNDGRYWLRVYLPACLLDAAGILFGLAIPVFTGAALDASVPGFNRSALRWPIGAIASAADLQTPTQLVTGLCGAALLSTAISVVCLFGSTALLAGHVRKLQSALRERTLRHILSLPLRSVQKHISSGMVSVGA